MTALLIILAVIAILISIISYLVFCAAFRPPKRKGDDWVEIPDNPQCRAFKDETLRLCRLLSEIEGEDVSITSRDGLKLCGKYYEVRKGAPLEIQFHGWHGSPIRDFCGGNRIAREAGHNTLLIEERSMIRSEGRAITFGIKERYDCLSWCEWAADRFGSDTPVVIEGISMGAATVLMASDLPLPPNVKGVIADCPYSSPIGIMKKVGKCDMHVPECIIAPFARLASRLWGGFSLMESSAIESVKRTELPILLIHGDDDRFVPWEMSKELSEANPAIQFETFHGAGHGLSYMVDTERYEKVTTEFVRRVTGE